MKNNRNDRGTAWMAALLPAFLLSFLAVGCLAPRDGGGSETMVIGVSGRVVDASGNPSPGAAVRIRPEGGAVTSLPGRGEVEPPAALTREDGTFLIESLPPGGYVLECRADDGAALVEVRVEDSLVSLGDLVLRPTGAVRGIIVPPADSMILLSSVYVWVPGLTGREVAQAKDGFRFVLADIPAGRHTVRLQPAFPMELRHLGILEIPGVEVLSGDTLDLGSLTLPSRTEFRDSAYSADSLAVAAILRANGHEKVPVEEVSAVAGNRIVLLYSFSGLFTRFPKAIAALDRLEGIYLLAADSQATFEAVPGVTGMGAMRELSLQGYRLNGFPEWIRTLHGLTGLDITGAGLTAFPDPVLDLPFLQSLHLGGNRIPSLPPGIARMARLRRLILNGNELSALPRELLDMETLRGVSLRNNRLCGLSEEWKKWVSRQDSLFFHHADPLRFWSPTPDSGWEATQRCGERP